MMPNDEIVMRDGVERGQILKLPFRAPFDWRDVIAFLGPRCIPGVEAVEGGTYRRTIALDGHHGAVEIADGGDGAHLAARVRFPVPALLGEIERRLIRQFDLDADTAMIAAHLGRDPLLAPQVASQPGLRVPGAWDPFELSVRAILGQQISVAAATVIAGRIALLAGEPLRLEDGLPPPAGLFQVFPAPAQLVDADPGHLRIPRARAATIAAIARAFIDQPDLFRTFMSLDERIRRLDALPGIGPWTAHYIAMRALGARDAFPTGDLGLRKAAATAAGMPDAKELDARAEAWRPWRSYAALHLWASLGNAQGG